MTQSDLLNRDFVGSAWPAARQAITTVMVLRASTVMGGTNVVSLTRAWCRYLHTQKRIAMSDTKPDVRVFKTVIPGVGYSAQPNDLVSIDVVFAEDYDRDTAELRAQRDAIANWITLQDKRIAELEDALAAKDARIAQMQHDSELSEGALRDQVHALEARLAVSAVLLRAWKTSAEIVGKGRTDWSKMIEATDAYLAEGTK